MTRPVDDVGLGAAQDPLVVALDVGSTASRGGVYDATGRPVTGLQHKVPHAFTTAPDGTSEIDPDAVVAEIEEILDALTRDPALGTRIAGVAMDTFAASLLAVDADGRPLTGCLTYADSRCAGEVAALRAELDEHAVQQRTGTRIHTSYHAPRLRWLAGADPRTFAAAAGWWSLGEYVLHRLTGVDAAGTATAAWTGLLDRRTGELDAELLAAAGVRPEQFSPGTTSTTRCTRPTACGGRRSRTPCGSRRSPTASRATSAPARPIPASWRPPRRPAARCGCCWTAPPTRCRSGCGTTASARTGPSWAERSTTWAARSAGRRAPSTSAATAPRCCPRRRRRARRSCCRT
ncbi:FGGY family carbohydrate kinase [Cellulomonas sp. ATA003]|uniref:FGGY family carbohydrate kinase n=1 Tax=Cellulomonas sp. ATA003 TaxID=3073064 RepID=UPI002873D29C|nr:FGGY family carbohydrate kinase [Cellulomonas sp. ATA003]WNB85845.1 FGGY family carbohydrate kinase [Cellulomonas sp. ATA003]